MKSLNNGQRYKIMIAYDGTDYAGWLQQKDQPSIVQTLQDTFMAVFKKPIVLLGASKTDAGVHALGQMAVGVTDIAIEPEKLQWAWNNALPASILIRSLEIADTFHPHHNIDHKIYYYHLFLERPLPLYARYGAFIPYTLDVERFKKTLCLFQGTHNFAAFYTGNDRTDTVRAIDTITVSYMPEYGAYRIEIVGKKFLRHMIRRMIGAALAVASRHSLHERDIIEALTTQRSNCELPTAPAQGLMLGAIRYKDTL